MQWLTIMAVAIGGAGGALARWAISSAINVHRPPGSFPLGTFVANMVGCLVLGFCYIAFDRSNLPPALRSGITVGLLGALTTFSTYCLESYQLLESKSYGLAAANLLGSVVVGLIGVVLGTLIARAIGL
jgi:CrcB protein